LLQNIALVILSAGNSTRFQSNLKKQWLRIGDDPLWLHVTKKISKCYSFSNIIITASAQDIAYMQNFIDDEKIKIVQGGNTRQESIKNAIDTIDSEFVMVTDVARACIDKKTIKELIKNKNDATCIVPYLNVSDTVIYEKDTINRDDVKLIQTPQLSNTKALKDALKQNVDFTDDSSAIKANNGTIKYILGSQKAQKLTFANDIKKIPCLKKPSKQTFVGYGYDVHQFEKNKPMVLGGVKFDENYGFKAHSDGDVLIHSLIDALLGASGAGDIGEFFPDTDPKYKNCDSTILLQDIHNFISNVGYEIVNIDISIIAQQPKINPYKKQIKKSLSNILNLPKQFINIKATTSEKMGFIGRSEGVAVHSVATLKYYNWRKK
jgi:2-C-methyl-D-erythritol 4-phosphate cytidylyltransferase/2-C-methyl-D-erythritol 2,4-cyclodiphosphate synthase